MLETDFQRGEAGALYGDKGDLGFHLCSVSLSPKKADSTLIQKDLES